MDTGFDLDMAFGGGLILVWVSSISLKMTASVGLLLSRISSMGLISVGVFIVGFLGTLGSSFDGLLSEGDGKS